MRAKRAFAAAATLALTVGVAACGDDDADDQEDVDADSEQADADSEQADADSEQADDEAVDAPAVTDPSDTDDAPPVGDGTDDADDEVALDDDLVADCATFDEFFVSAGTDAMVAVSEGDEFTDEARADLESAREQLDGMDLSTDGGEAMRGQLADLFDALLDAGVADSEIIDDIDMDPAAQEFDEACISR